MIYQWNLIYWERFLGLIPKLPHAVLMHGPKGTGKLEFARSAAAVLLCNAPAMRGGRREVCGKCPSCLLYASGNHPDFFTVQPEADTADGEEGSEVVQATSDKRKKPSTQIKIGQIRDVVGNIQSGTHQGGTRVILVAPAEAMNSATANALLKTLEEPPSQTVVLLVSNEPERLLPTIRSRCQAIGFGEPDRQSCVRWLKEKGIEDADARLALFGGSPLAALESAEDGAGPDLKTLADRFVSAEDALSCADALGSAEPPAAVDWLQRWTTDLVLFRLTGRVRYHPGFEAALKPVAQAASVRPMLNFLRVLAEYRRIARHPVNARLYVERLALDYFEAVRATPESGKSNHTN
jgi:DNA polymerase-3 subunit delta'